MLTPSEREKLTSMLADMKPQAREAHIARLRQVPGKADVVSVLEGIHRQLLFAEAAAATPLEIVGDTRTPRKVSTVRPTSISPLIQPDAAKKAALAVVIVGGSSAFVGLVVIPFLVAVSEAIVSLAPYAVGIACAGLFIRSFFAGIGEKKTDNNPAGNSGGNVYNVYIGEHQNVRVFSGGKEGER